MPHRIRRELRLLRAHALITTPLLIVVLLTGFLQIPQRMRFTEIDVERINIVEPDGKLRMVISNRPRSIGPIYKGKPFGYPGGTRPGIIFFNDEGTENGGLTFQGQRRPDGTFQAGTHMSFDQFDQDQVVGLQYSDNGTRRSAGLHVWDRSPDVAISSIIDMVEARSRATGPARDSIDRAIRATPGMEKSAHRIFLGSENRNATLLLRDVAGRPRVRLYVDSANVARLEFLNESGQVVDAFPR
jgi:hypothetical protein